MEKLKKYRLERGMTLQAVADNLGVVKSTVCLHETGKRTPNIELLQKYALLYNCKVDDLIDPLGESEEE